MVQRTTHSARELNKFGSGKDGFTEGDPLVPTPRTVAEAIDLDQAQECIVRTVEDAGISLVSENYDQFVDAIKVHADRAAERHAILSLRQLPVTTATAYTLVGIAADGAGNIAAVGETGGNVYVQESTDHGETWTQHGPLGTVDEVYGITYANGYFVGVGYNTGDGTLRAFYTATLGSWSNVTISGTSYGFRGLAIGHDGTNFVIVGENGLTWYTPNGPPSTGWTNESANNSYSQDINAVASDGTTFVAAGAVITGDGATTRTTDVTGGTWTYAAIPNVTSSNEALSAATDGAGRWLFGLEFGGIAITEDFSTWERVTFGSSSIVAACYTGRHFVIVTADSKIAVSIDGLTWESRDMNATSLAACEAVDVFYACGADGSNKITFGSGAL